MSLHGGFDGFNDPDRGGLGPLAGNAISNQLTKQVDAAPSVWGEGGAFGKGGAASLALGGLETLGTLWGAFQQNKLAKKQLKLQESAYKTNLANSTKVYNTALEDRIRARYATEGRSSEADAKIAENRL